ncbi:helix-turn-helix domain-containing protein [Barnesiella intestinihominis]|uniref:helix-turn-helix domain-containing protein n=1 Tax=Barnesiella intestinihominis TaxID=487174 RepID=UPI0026E0BA2E|nr:helix-turn-helix domain-containing protein [Barnesiella intestinihominis]
MKVICIDERVWISFMERLKGLQILAKQVETMYKPATKDNWLDTRNVCRALSISKRTLQYYREKRRLPFSNVGGKFFFRERDVEEFLASRTRYKITPSEKAKSHSQAKRQ